MLHLITVTVQELFGTCGTVVSHKLNYDKR